MLKKGGAWHYNAYDQRLELSTVSDQLNFFVFLLILFDLPILNLCYKLSGKGRLEPSELVYGQHRTLRSHGSGGRTDAKADEQLTTVNCWYLTPDTILPRHNQTRVNIHNQGLELLAKKRNTTTLQDNCDFKYYLIQILCGLCSLAFTVDCCRIFDNCFLLVPCCTS